jgi:endonuclease YncB( thermonuclease family)
VVGILDGDTLTVLAGTATVKVLLADIGAPEHDQAFGTARSSHWRVVLR